MTNYYFIPDITDRNVNNFLTFMAGQGMQTNIQLSSPVIRKLINSLTRPPSLDVEAQTFQKNLVATIINEYCLL